MKPTCAHRKQSRRGMSAMLTCIMLVALCGLVSLGVDVGHAQLAKTELRTAADAAARAGARGLAVSTNQGREDAVAVAAANACDGTPVELVPNTDVEFGHWNTSTRTFTVSSSSPTAIRVTARREAARGNAISLSFARLIGKESCDVSASAVATFRRRSAGGYIGLDGFVMKNNAFFGSYRSSETTSPTESGAGSNCVMGSNGVISVVNNTEVQGDMWMGPSASTSGTIDVSGETIHRTEPIPAPAEPDWDPGTNPAGVPRNYTVNSTTTLPGGTYWFTSLTVNKNKNLSFSGPATLYVNGNILIDANLTASGSIPSNLKIYQLGTGRTFGDDKANNTTIIAQIEAPGSVCTFKNKVMFYGSAFFKSIETKNSAHFFYDEDAGGANGTVTVSLVQ